MHNMFPKYFVQVNKETERIEALWTVNHSSALDEGGEIGIAPEGCEIREVLDIDLPEGMPHIQVVDGYTYSLKARGFMRKG